MSPQKGNIVIIILALVAIISVGTAGYLFVQNQQLKEQPATAIETITTTVTPTPTPTLIPTPNATTIPTNSWTTYTVQGVNQSVIKNITYQLPTNLKPLWVNGGHYYQTVTLPNNTTLAIIPVGKDQGLQWTWQSLIEMIDFNHFKSQKRSINNNQAIEFSGNIGSNQSSSLNILAEAIGQTQGVGIKINDDLYIEFLLYREKINGKNDSAFAQDSVLFSQILSTFKFLDNSQNSTSDWKTYQNNQVKFKINYPPTWGLREDEMSVHISSPEANNGIISIYWSGGFGGGPCPNTHQLIETTAGKIDMCQMTFPDGSISLSRANDAQGETFIDKTSSALMIKADAKQTTQIKTAVDILKTFTWL